MGTSSGGNFGKTKGSQGKVSLPPNRSQLMHIFRDKTGHLLDTPANRKLLLDIANNKKYFKDIDKFGITWHIKYNSQGHQIWTASKNGILQEGGKNIFPHKWDPATGLNKNPDAKLFIPPNPNLISNPFKE